MEDKGNEQEERQLVRIEKLSLDDIQMAEQLYYSAGLGPVVDAGLKDYDEHLQMEDKLIRKVLGPRGSDIKGYAEAVAKRVAFATYALLNKQYGGKVGDLRSYIMALQEERDRANTRYDDLLGRVVGILGDEYKELRTDSKTFMEKLTTTLGEDLKESRIDKTALTERLADIDGLRAQIKSLENEKEQLKEKHESRVTALTSQHSKEIENHKSQIVELVSKTRLLESGKATLTSDLARLAADHHQLTGEAGNLRAQVAVLDSKTKALESEKTTLTGDLAQLRKDLNQLNIAITKLTAAVPYEEIGGKLGEELYTYLLEDSKVPHVVIDGVGRFIDFKKYLGLAAEKGAEKAAEQAEKTLRNMLSK